MATERDRGPVADAAAARLAATIDPGSLLEATPECLVVARADGRIVFANHLVERLTGFDRGSLLGESVELLIAADLLDLESGSRVEAVCRTNGGGEVPVKAHIGRIEGPERLIVITFRDASELRAGREARFEAEAKYRALVEQIPAVVYLDPIDENSDSIYVSPQVVTLLGVDQQEWLTDPYCWRKHVHPEDLDRVWEEYEDAFNNHTTLNHEYRMVHEDGTVRWVLEQAYPIEDGSGEPWLIQGVIFDITERKVAEEQVAFLAYHDKLTGLPNRVLFEEMLENAISRARRHDLGVGVALPRSRQLQARERLARPRRRRPVARPARGAAARMHPRDGPRRTPGRRRIPAAALRPGSRRRPDAGTDAAMLVAESVAARVHEALAEPFDLNGTEFYRDGLDRHHVVPAGRPRRRDTDEERRRGDVPVEAQRAGGLRRVRDERRRPDARSCRSRPGCGGPWSSSTGCCTTSRSWSCTTGRSRRWRRSCAGRTPTGASCRQASSSPWPRSSA